jgi:hypothetical protein
MSKTAVVSLCAATNWSWSEILVARTLALRSSCELCGVVLDPDRVSDRHDRFPTFAMFRCRDTGRRSQAL